MAPAAAAAGELTFVPKLELLRRDRLGKFDIDVLPRSLVGDHFANNSGRDGAVDTAFD